MASFGMQVKNDKEFRTEVPHACTSKYTSDFKKQVQSS